MTFGARLVHHRRAAGLSQDPELFTIAERRSGLVVVNGAAGTGKTSLAVRAAHLLEECFPDGPLLMERGMTKLRHQLTDALRLSA